MVGCSSTGGTTTNPIPDTTTASSIGLATGISTSVDSAVLQAISVASVSGIKALGTTSTPTYSDGWWQTTVTTTVSAYTYSSDVNFRAWSSDGSTLTEAINSTMLDAISASNLDQLYAYAVYEMIFGSNSFTISIGSAQTDSGCFKITDMLTSPTFNGSISISGTSDSTSYSVTITYSDMTTVSGLPSGTANFTVVSDGSTVATGTITYAVSGGSCTATINFAGGDSTSTTVTTF